VPVLRVLDALGGEATISEVKETFCRRLGKSLDPAKDWHTVTGNHGKGLWRDHCGARVAYDCLRPRGYVTTERGGKKGSVYRLTDSARTKARNQEPFS